MSQIFFSDVNYIWIFPPKTRQRNIWKWYIPRYPKSKMMDFRQFQTGKTAFLAKFDTLKLQFQWKLHFFLAGNFKCGWNQSKNLFFINISPLLACRKEKGSAKGTHHIPHLTRFLVPKISLQTDTYVDISPWVKHISKLSRISHYCPLAL